jgi:membrane peptidoglycan carboxypeptidase
MRSEIKSIRTRRRSRTKSNRRLIFARITLFSLSVFGLCMMILVFVGGIFYSDLIQDLPDITGVQNWYSPAIDPFPPPVQVLDRTGENVVATLIHPVSEERHWLKIGSTTTFSIPESVIDAVIATQDETFWRHGGFDTRKILGGIVDTIFGSDENSIYRSIPQRLVYMTILPATDFKEPLIARYIRSAVLAQNLVESYSKEQIMEWYLNSVRFGHLTQGIDAASLVFFDKHATDLSLAESAVIASLLDHPGLDPYETFALVKERQGSILASMTNKGMVSMAQFHTSLDEPLNFAKLPNLHEHGLAEFTERRMLDAIKPVIYQRLGLEIRTSIDHELQREVICTTQFFLDRLSSISTVMNPNGSLMGECESASFLPPLRPGDLGVNHLVDDSALVAVDPQQGEILALFGDIASERTPGRMTYPLLYLSAFSRGYAPGSMIIDTPISLEEQQTIEEAQGPGNGPVRMRNALVGSYPYAAERTMELVGVDTFLKLVQQLGIRPGTGVDGNSNLKINNLLTTSLLDLGYGYSAFANLGTMTGEKTTSNTRSNALSPLVIKKINDPSGVELYAVTQISQSILSPSLAYLIVDILSDTSARWPIYGRPNVFDMDRPVAVMTEGEGDLIYDSWTIGFTPSLVLGVWVGNADGGEMYRVNSENGAASLWHALTEYTSSTTPSEGWVEPSEIVEVEICEPSGQLPTEYCPYLVQELFIRGTEPFQYDTLYVPLQINKESGQLATMSTPLDLIEERVFFIPPSEASYWAEFQDFELPPSEYDAIRPLDKLIPDSLIEFPSMFSYASGRIRVRGRAVSDDFRYFRLQYGRGLNPTRWFLIGEDLFAPRVRGLLTIWDTDGLDGLYTLQLLVVDRDGKLSSDFVHLTIDNELPVITLDNLPGEILLSSGSAEEVRLIAQASDNVSVKFVEFILDDRVVGVINNAPYVMTFSIEDEGEYEISVRAHDFAGNVGESEVQEVRVIIE